MKKADCRVETFLPSPGPGISVFGSSYHCAPEGGCLVSIHSLGSRSDTVDAAFVRRSPDNGRTWSEAESWPTRFDAAAGTGRRHPRGGYVDPMTGRYLSVWTEGILPNDDPLEGMKHWVLFYSVSEDSRRTDVVSEQIVQEGSEFNQSHPLPGVTVGKNCVMIGDLTCRPITLPDGSILLPAQSAPVGPDGEYWNPCRSFTYSDDFGESERLTLSNFYAREDQESGELLLHMTRLFAGHPGEGKLDWTADALLYRISPDIQ